MAISSDGSYNSYTGTCYDRKHGARDRISGRRITDAGLIAVLETGGRLNDQQHIALISEFFGAPITPT
jgi:hypothetical protein